MQIKKPVLLMFVSFALIISSGCTRDSGEDTSDAATKTLTITCSVCREDRELPVKHAFDQVDAGENVSLPLNWTGGTDEVESYLVLMTDEHEIADDFVHWLVVDIPASVTELAEGASGTDQMPADSRELTNDFGLPGYGGPWPPAGSGKHVYRITVYGLRVPTVSLTGQFTKAEVLEEIKDTIIISGSVTGYFEL